MFGKIQIILFFIVLIVPFGFVFASTQASLTIENVRVTDKGNYDLIQLDVVIRAPDLEVGEQVGFGVKTGTWLTNENGKIYYRTPGASSSECNDKGLTLMGNYAIDVKSGGKGSFTLCFDVDKKYNTYTLQVGGKEIGSIDMTNKNNPITRGPDYRPETEGMPCIRLLSQAEKDANPNRIQDGLMGKNVNGKCVPTESIKDILINSKEKNQEFNFDSFFRGLDEMIEDVFDFIEELPSYFRP